MGRLDGKRALIVGASRGIGAEIARSFAREGAELAICARSQEALEEVRDELLATGAQAAAFAVDAAEPKSVEEAVDVAEEALGQVDILVYAAGVAGLGRFEEIDDEVWTNLYEVNVMGAVRFSRALLPGMRERGWGRIINIASTAAKYGSMYQSPYNATKHAMLGLTRCLALETAADGITVNAVCPGFVDTEMFRAGAPVIGELIGVPADQVVDTLVAARVPQKRLLEPAEVAALTTYVASPEAAGMTGMGLTLAGGLILV
jgi:NAD(P)-dependent dehydrogenase (short-subunit alcohol dehydrogenase family)